MERQAEQLITAAPTAPGVVALTMLLDEPDIHCTRYRSSRSCAI
jgi:hypothetical protein